MSFDNSQSVTIDGVTTALPRTSSLANGGQWTAPDGSLVLSVTHTSGKRQGHSIRLQTREIVSDPFIPSTNIPQSASATFTVNGPNNGMTVDKLKDLADGLVAYLAASSGARVSQLLGGEN